MEAAGTKQSSPSVSPRLVSVEEEKITQFKNNPEAFLLSEIRKVGCSIFAAMRGITYEWEAGSLPDSLKYISGNKELRTIAMPSILYLLGKKCYEQSSYIAAFTEFSSGYDWSGKTHTLLREALAEMLIDKKAMKVIVRNAFDDRRERMLGIRNVASTNPKASLQEVYSILFAGDASVFEELDEVTKYQASYILGIVFEEVGEYALAFLCYEKSAEGVNKDALNKFADWYLQGNPDFNVKKNDQLAQQYRSMADLQDPEKLSATFAKWNDEYQAIDFYRAEKIKNQNAVEALDSDQDENGYIEKTPLKVETPEKIENVISANNMPLESTASSSTTVNNTHSSAENVKVNINSKPVETVKVRGDNEIRSLTQKQKEKMQEVDEIFDL